jgi:hypothetical protein
MKGEIKISDGSTIEDFYVNERHKGALFYSGVE